MGSIIYKLLQGLHKDGYQTFSFSLRPEHDWQSILLDMELELSEDEKAYKKYQILQSKGLDEAKQAEYFLKFLLARYGGKLALFFDNLESVQDGQYPHAITDPTLQHWLQAAQSLTRQGLKLILTSRWRLPDWADAAHYPLGKPVYGDYVAMVRLQGLPLQGKRLQTAYETLGGNFRALEFFARATQGMSAQEEHEFTASLGKAAAESQTDMALAKVVELRSSEEIALLHRLLAYQTTVPLLGVEIVGEPSTPSPLSREAGEGEQETTGVVLQRLLAVSLVEQYATPNTQQTEYQLAPLVRSWLLANGAPEPDQPLLQKAANFLLWELEERQNTSWEHKLATHAALLAANLTEQGQRLVLDWIIEPLNRAGMYRTLLDDWLPPLAEADTPQIRGIALNQIGKQYLHLAQYDTALDFFKRSLTIQQENSDKTAEGIILNNISQIYSAHGDYDTALTFLKKSLAIQQEIGDKTAESSTLNNMGTTAYNRGDYDTALDFFKRSLAIQQEIGDKTAEDLLLNNISQIYQARGDYGAAFEQLKKSLAITQKIGNRQLEGATLNNIGLFFHARGDYDAALDYFKKSLAVTQEIGDKSTEGTTLNNISQIFGALGNYNLALDHLKKSLAIQQEIGNKFGESTTLNNMATTAHKCGDYDAALDYLKKSLAIAKEIGDVAGFCTTLFNMGHIHFRNEEATEAVHAWVTVYGIAKQINLVKQLQTLEKLAEELGLPGGLQSWEKLAQQMTK